MLLCQRGREKCVLAACRMFRASNSVRDSYVYVHVHKLMCDYCVHVDCQQQAGLAAWVPFQDSASAVTQLYKGMSYSHIYACVYQRACTCRVSVCSTCIFAYMYMHYVCTCGSRSCGGQHLSSVRR